MVYVARMRSALRPLPNRPHHTMGQRWANTPPNGGPACPRHNRWKQHGYRTVARPTTDTGTPTDPTAPKSAASPTNHQTPAQPDGSGASSRSESSPTPRTSPTWRCSLWGSPNYWDTYFAGRAAPARRLGARRGGPRALLQLRARARSPATSRRSGTRPRRRRRSSPASRAATTALRRILGGLVDAPGFARAVGAADEGSDAAPRSRDDRSTSATYRAGASLRSLRDQPRPTKGIPAAMTVRNSTLASRRQAGHVRHGAGDIVDVHHRLGRGGCRRPAALLLACAPSLGGRRCRCRSGRRRCRTAGHRERSTWSAR